jgi:hypothetical protein
MTSTTSTRSVPLFVVELLDPSFTAYDRIGVRVGEATEAGIEELNLVTDDLGFKAAAYWEHCRRFWDDISNDRRRNDAVEIHRRLMDVRQIDSQQGRLDLVSEMKSLADTALAPLLEQITAGAPDWTAVRVHPLVTSLHREGDCTEVSVRYSGRENWQPALGGVCSRGEIGRVFTFNVNHTSWRDRRVRRLVSMRIEAIELWPNPQFKVLPV